MVVSPAHNSRAKKKLFEDGSAVAMCSQQVVDRLIMRDVLSSLSVDVSRMTESESRLSESSESGVGSDESSLCISSDNSATSSCVETTV